MYEAEKQQQEIDEGHIEILAEKLVRAAAEHKGRVIMVTNEVGTGIVPENALARRYRDFVGRCSQVVAKDADQVFLVSCGIPLQIK
jgi:adenosylcobinamide kinase/adenosylcobinamide-phosphate guanylyltransferase